MSLKSFKELVVWQRSIELVEQAYRIARALPASEQFGLASQMTRAAVSIPANIAEGYGRRGRKEYLQFLSIASASARELEALFAIVSRVYPDVDARAASTSLVEVHKMLAVLKKKLRQTPSTLNPQP